MRAPRYLAGRPLLFTEHPTCKRVYDFIISFKRTHDGNSPTIREIQVGCKLSSTSVTFYFLEKLAALGLIRRPEPQIGNRYACKIEVVGGRWILLPSAPQTEAKEA